MAFGWFKSRKTSDMAVHGIYRVVVERMREPVFYTDLGVPDTLEGRFDLLLMHAFAVFHRITREGDAGKAFNQRLFDYMIEDLDVNLRNMGVGDDGVRHRIKKMTEAYHGRVVAYEEALKDDADPNALVEALDRNLYGTVTVEQDVVARMADYLRDQVDVLMGQPFSELENGVGRFGPLPEAKT